MSGSFDPDQQLILARYPWKRGGVSMYPVFFEALYSGNSGAIIFLPFYRDLINHKYFACLMLILYKYLNLLGINLNNSF